MLFLVSTIRDQVETSSSLDFCEERRFYELDSVRRMYSPSPVCRIDRNILSLTRDSATPESKKTDGQRKTEGDVHVQPRVNEPARQCFDSGEPLTGTVWVAVFLPK